MNWHWWKRVEEEAKKEQTEGYESAVTGDERLKQVRDLAQRSEAVRKQDEELQRRNRFVQTFLKAFEEGLR